MPNNESEAAMRQTRILEHAAAIFGSREKALRWLAKPKPRFGGRIPLQMLADEADSHDVEDLLGQIEFGMFA